jgi:hypothetical protein
MIKDCVEVTDGIVIGYIKELGQLWFYSLPTSMNLRNTVPSSKDAVVAVPFITRTTFLVGGKRSSYLQESLTWILCKTLVDVVRVVKSIKLSTSRVHAKREFDVSGWSTITIRKISSHRITDSINNTTLARYHYTSSPI